MDKEYIKDKYTKDDIFNAKIYMMEYKFLDEIHKLNAGIIGRFFEKIFGTSAYADIEECLKNKYNLSYCEAKDVLYYSNNDKYIYNPYFKYVILFFNCISILYWLSCNTLIVCILPIGIKLLLI